jgi:Tfp pilus assembly protein PilF
MRKDTLKGSVLELNLGIVYARMGNLEEARRILTDWLARSRNEHVVPYAMALLHFALDDKDPGFEWLEKGFQEHDGWLMGIKVDYLLEDVRDDPRFRALLNKMNLA